MRRISLRNYSEYIRDFMETKKITLRASNFAEGIAREANFFQLPELAEDCEEPIQEPTPFPQYGGKYVIYADLKNSAWLYQFAFCPDGKVSCMVHTNIPVSFTKMSLAKSPNYPCRTNRACTKQVVLAKKWRCRICRYTEQNPSYYVRILID